MDLDLQSDRSCVLNSNFSVQSTRIEFTTEQKSLLMSEFSRSPYISCKRRDYLSTKLGIGKQHICTWFYRRRFHIRDCEVQINWSGMSKITIIYICHSSQNCVSFFYISVCSLVSFCIIICAMFRFFGMNVCLRKSFRLTKNLKDRQVIKVNWNITFHANNNNNNR